MFKYLTTIIILGAAAHAAIPLQSQPSWTWDAQDRAYGGLAFADVDGDGDLDLVVGCYDGSNWYPPITDYHNMVFYNDGDKLASSPGWTSALERHTAEIDTGDVNGDGVPDVFAANGGSSYQPNSVYYGKTGGPNTSPDWSSSQPAWATGSCLGDIDGDGDVDRDDINLILAVRNQPASGADDPRDLDGDGVITVLDARIAATMCTRPGCATA